MHKYEVGTKYHLDVTNQKEGAIFDFDNAGATLLLLYDKPTNEEIYNIKKGELKIGMYHKDDILFMLYKFGAEPWIDAPYNVNLSTSFELKEIKSGSGYFNNIILVNIKDNIIKAMRCIGWSESFSRYFNEFIEKQRHIAFNKNQYDANIKNTYKNYTTKDIVGRADILTKIGCSIII